jgi:hypothetical protein
VTTTATSPSAEPLDTPGSGSRAGLISPESRIGPWIAVALAVVWGLWELRAEVRHVPYLDDSSIHEQMTRFASARISAGHLPLTSWFPYLGLGSPQYLHYQSLPSMTAGLIGTVVAPDTVFRWSLYLLLAFWPVPVFLAGRLFGLSRWSAAAAAAISPFLASVPGIGYETKAYVWAGYGVWTQLWAAWTLPLAWAFTHRALSSLRRRNLIPAVLFIMVTIALHFETGYLAIVPLVVWPFLVPSDLWRRLGRAVVVGGASVLASAWVVVPVITQSHWAAKNQVLEGTGLENGYGARQVLDWLVTGRLYDDGRFPIVTILLAVGIGVCIARWRSNVAGRALITIWCVTLLMTFGRTTFGGLYAVIPGSSDVFIRRFQMGVQLSGILLAGVGAAFLGRWLLDTIVRRLAEDRRARLSEPAGRALMSGLCVAALVIVLAPAWNALDSYDAHNAINVGLQAEADAQQGPQINRVIEYVRAHPRGRVYAGMPDNWGSYFTVGAVPVFKYLENEDIDEVGYTLRTASLMTDPEYHFDESNPGDYPLFGIGYIVYPAGREPPVAAHRVGCSGPYCLWALPNAGAIHLYDTTGVLRANRADVGTKSAELLDSPLLNQQRDLMVAFNGGRAARPTAPHGRRLTGRPGRVLVEHSDLANGEAGAVVRATRAATVVLSASYDPGWHAIVDGHSVPTVMVAPALVGVVVGPGTHTVTFHYGGYGSYDELFVLALAVFAFMAGAPTLARAIRRRR